MNHATADEIGSATVRVDDNGAFPWTLPVPGAIGRLRCSPLLTDSLTLSVSPSCGLSLATLLRA